MFIQIENASENENTKCKTKIEGEEERTSWKIRTKNVCWW